MAEKLCPTDSKTTEKKKEEKEVLKNLKQEIRSIRYSHDRDLFCVAEAKTAAVDGQFEVVKFLLSQVANEQVRDQCCMEIARPLASEGELEMMKFLLQNIIGPDTKNHCFVKAAESASTDGQLHVVEFLITTIDDPIVRQLCSVEATKCAAVSGQLEVSEFLVQSIDDKNIRDRCCTEAAKFAAREGQLDVFQFLYKAVENQHLRSDFRRDCAVAASSRHQENVLIFLGLEPDWLFQSSIILSFIAAMAIEGRNSVLTVTLSKMQPAQIVQLLCLSIFQSHVALALSLVNDKRFSRQHVDLPDSSGATALMLAADAGHHEVIEKLLNLGASVRAEDSQGRTALSRACKEGHVRAAKTLADRGADASHRDGRGLTCEQLAERHGHSQVLRLLKPSSRTLRDQRLSEELHRLLSKAGFTRKRAEYQQGMAKWLEAVAQVLTQDGRRMTGSYAEGWANSLVQMNGRTAAHSDIDWTVLIATQIFHLEGGCDGASTFQGCRDATTKLRVLKGHAQVPVGSGSQPSVEAKACGMRPAQDLCHAMQCCSSYCEDRVRRLLNYSVYNVHLVRATRPKMEDELRVSFSFHERSIMKRLCTVQGQLFTAIKFIFKLHLPVIKDAPGLKTYHAKTLLFFMLEKHGVKNASTWQPENLIALLKESLEMMLNFIDSSSSPDECMPHFFMQDAPLYFKNAGIGGDFINTKATVRDRLSELRSDIDRVVEQMRALVRPLKSESFYFHPFTLLPLTTPPSVSQIRSCRYGKFADAYSVVHQCIRELQSESSEALMKQLSLLNELQWCKHAYLCMTVMAHLKFGESEEAERVIKELQSSQVQATCKMDWFLRFCLSCCNPPRFPFLPEFTQTLFTARLSQPRSSHHLYVNFRCLSWSLQAELLRNRSPAIAFDNWKTELEEDPDLEELLTLAHYSDCREHVEFCLRQMETVKDEKFTILESQDEEKINKVKEKLNALDSEAATASKWTQTAWL